MTSVLDLLPDVLRHPAFDGKTKQKWAASCKGTRDLVMRASTAVAIGPLTAHDVELQRVMERLQHCCQQDGLQLRALKISWALGQDKTRRVTSLSPLSPFLGGLH